jgi:hypothetical protein
MLERMKIPSSACLVILITGCGGGSTSPPVDAAAPLDSGSQDGAAADAADDASSDAATADAATDGGVIPEQSCAHSLACGTPGESCLASDGGGCGTSSCYCQSYGQPRCLDLTGDAGGAGAPCSSSNACGAGLSCVQFGPSAFCFYCGD